MKHILWLIFLGCSSWMLAEEESLSNDFTVSVSGIAVPVRVASCSSDTGGSYSFASIPVADSVVVEITSDRSLEKLRLLPVTPGVVSVIVGKTITLTVSKPCHMVLEVEDVVRPLFLFFDTPEKAPPSAAGKRVKYYGPGVHRPENGRIFMNQGETLYLAPGAIVKAAILAREVDQIRIIGRGILDGSDFTPEARPFGWMTSFHDCTNVEISGITIRGQFATAILLQGCRDVRIDQVKILGGRVDWDDGIHLWNSSNVSVMNSCIRTAGDCIALKGKWDEERRPVQKVTCERMLLWGDRHRICVIGHESQTSGFSDISLSEWTIARTVGPILLLEPGEETLLSQVVVNQWSVEVGPGLQEPIISIQPLVNEFMVRKTPGQVQSIRLTELAFNGTPEAVAPVFSIAGADKDHRVRGLTLGFFSWNGKLLDSAQIRLGKNVDSVVWEKKKKLRVDRPPKTDL